MLFNFCLGNVMRSKDDWGANFAAMLTAEDLIVILRLGLEALGHDVMVSRTYVARNAVNLFVGGFHNEHRDVARKLKAAGYRFGLIVTEWFNDGLYNPFEQQEQTSRRLYGEFCEGAAHADFLWYLVEESAETCRRANPNSHFLKIGHVDGYANLTPPEQRRQTWDFSFAGYSSDHRQSVLNALQARGFTVAGSILEPDYIRRTTLECAKVTMSIQKTPQHSFVSLTRVPHAIMNRVPIVVEYDGPQHYLAPYCILAAPDRFLTACEDLVRREDLINLVNGAAARYAAELPMTEIMDRIVSETLGHPSSQRG